MVHTESAALPRLETMSLEAKAAQLVMIDIPDLTLGESTRAHLQRYPWNGVILFAKNVENRAQVVNLVRAIHEASEIQPILSVDQEGGLVDRFRFPDMSLSPGGMALAATGDPECTRQAHEIMGRELASLGMHLDFAPCLDVNSNPSNPIIGVRSFGEDPASVAAHGRAAIRGLRSGGVGSTAKHFPGHGDTSQDSHILLPTVGHSRERLECTELVPFVASIEEQVEAIMTAHVTFPAFDPRPGLPATLSEPTLNGLLRTRMGYQGLIYTDSMAMQAVTDNFGVAEGAVQSLLAGADVILACGPFSNQLETVQALVEGVRSGRIPQARLDESVARVLAFKARFHVLPEESPSYPVQVHQTQMRAIVDRTVTLLRNREQVLPLRPATSGRVLVLTPDLLPITPLGEMSRSESLARHLAYPAEQLDEQVYPVTPQGPAAGQLVEAARAADTVVLAVYARDRLTDLVRELVEAVSEANPRTVVVSLSSPYLLADVPQAAAYLVGYNYTPFSLEAVGRCLTGDLNPQGRVPVSLPGCFTRGDGLSYT